MKVRFLLEIYSNSMLDRAVVLPHVESYDVAREEASVLTWTLGETPEREHTGVRETRITLRGASGRSPRATRDASGYPAFLTGAAHIQALDDFLAGYQRDSEDAEGHPHEWIGYGWSDKTRHIYMVFVALDYGHAFLVEPVIFHKGKSVARHNFTTGWDLTLRAYGSDEVVPDGLLEKAVVKARAATAFIDEVNSYPARSTLLLRDLRYSLEEFKEPVRALGRTVLAAMEVVDEAVGGLGFPVDLVREISRGAASSRAAILSRWERLPRKDRDASRDALLELLAPIGAVQRSADGLLGAAGGATGDGGAVAFGSWLAPPASRSSSAPVMSFVVPGGVTLRDLAEELLGSGALWTVIADLNGMTSATAMNDGSPFRAGLTILVPVPAPTAGGSQGAGGQDVEVSPKGDPYGGDVLLRDGDWALDGDEATDVRWVRGPANLRQGLATRFATVQGECGPFPALGLPRLVGEGIGDEGAALVAAHGRRQALRDPRIAGVTKVEVTDEGDTITANLDLVAQNGGRVQLVAPVPKPGGNG